MTCIGLIVAEGMADYGCGQATLVIMVLARYGYHVAQHTSDCHRTWWLCERITTDKAPFGIIEHFVSSRCRQVSTASVDGVTP